MMSPSFDPFVHHPPANFKTNPDAIAADAKALADARATLAERLIRDVPIDEATFDSVIQPLADEENARAETENHLKFYASTSPDKDIRDASSAVIDVLNVSEIDFFSRKHLFLLVDRARKDAQKDATSSPLDEESLHYMQHIHHRFILHGCGITNDDVHAQFLVQSKRIASLAKQSRKNMSNEKTGLWFKPEELEGVPNAVINKLPAGDSESPQAGYLWVSTKVPFSAPVMEYATRESTRKRMLYAVRNRMPENVPLHRELVLLRHEAARLLGYPNHFAFKTSQKMVKNPETVQRLIDEVHTALLPVSRDFSAKLLQLKIQEANDLGKPLARPQLFAWDSRYYETRLEQDHNKTHVRCEEYFELDHTLNKLLEMYEQIFSVRMVPVEGTPEGLVEQGLVWHPDVRMFSAWDMHITTEPALLGYVYFDFFPRDGKFTHVGQYNLRQGYQKPDGSRFLPASCLVMNYLRPSPSHPTLLDLDAVRKLFHELGHCYHNILSHARYAAMHKVDSDFVETPSMMLEQFFWDPEIIQQVSYHYSHISPEFKQAWLSTLPETEQNRDQEKPAQLTIEEARHLAGRSQEGRIRSSLNELFFATYDMRVHSPASSEELAATNLAEMFNRLRAEIFCVASGEALGEGWDCTQGQSVFRAIQGKYDAGYYAYILGRLFSLEIFQAGFARDLMSTENGFKYREAVLRKGGRQSEMKTLAEYLGHEPTSGPYLKWLGVESSDSARVQTFAQ